MEKLLLPRESFLREEETVWVEIMGYTVPNYTRLSHVNLQSFVATPRKDTSKNYLGLGTCQKVS